MYDFEEYLHLAFHASRQSPHASLGYLKEALRIKPDNVQALYLLAILHAELGLVDRAIAELTSVLALDAALETARLQLGLLWLDRGRTAEAAEQFLALRASKDQTVCTLGAAMVAAIGGQIDAACAQIRASLAANSTNEALRPLMQEVLARLERAGQPSATPQSPSAEPADKPIFMGAYSPTAAKR
jgi:tetratricopeptide (TPR) repeat protein